MGIGDWLGQNWFVLLQSAGIIGSILFTASTVRIDAKDRRVSHLLYYVEATLVSIRAAQSSEISLAQDGIPHVGRRVMFVKLSSGLDRKFRRGFFFSVAEKSARNFRDIERRVARCCIQNDQGMANRSVEIFITELGPDRPEAPCAGSFALAQSRNANPSAQGHTTCPNVQPQLMHPIAPSEKDTDNAALAKRQWDAADKFRAKSGLKSQEYSAPVLRLIFLRLAEVIEPYRGRTLDPACGSGGMFVSSARFVSEHKENPAAELSIHGLEGEIKHGNFSSYYDDPHDAICRSDFVLANPPFNVNAVDFKCFLAAYEA